MMLFMALNDDSSFVTHDDRFRTLKQLALPEKYSKSRSDEYQNVMLTHLLKVQQNCRKS